MFIILCIYTFFVFIRPQEYIPALSGVPIMPLLLISMFIGWLIDKDKRLRYPQDRFLFFFVLIAALSHLLHLYFGGAVGVLIKFMPILILYYVIVNSLLSWERIEKYFILIIVLTAIMALHGVLQFYNGGIGWTGQTFARKTTRIRYIGIFSDPNDLALVFIFSVPLLIYFISQKKTFWLRVLNISILIVILYATFLTQSRGAFVSLGMMIVYYGIRKYGLKKGLIAGAILLIPLLLFFAKGRLTEISTSEESAYGRIDAWYEGIQMLIRSPLWGVGPGMFTENNYLTAHNSYVLCFAETGLLGYFFWLGAIYYNIVGLSRSIQFELATSEEGTIVSKGFFLTISLIGFLTASFFLSRTYTIVLYINLALITAYLYYIEEQSGIDLYESYRNSDLWKITGWVFSSIILIFLFVKFSVK